MKKATALYILFFICISVSAQRTKPVAKLDEYIREAQAAEQEMNAPKACIAYDKAIALCRQNPAESGRLPELLGQYGSMLTYAGDYGKAVDAFTEALKLISKQGNRDKLLESRIFMQFGVLSFFQERWDDALYYYQKAEKGAKELGNKQGLSIAKNNIANIYQKKGNYSQAIKMYDECLALQESLQDTATICNTCFNIGTCYQELQESDKANGYFEQSFATAAAINDVEIIALSLLHLGEIAAQKGETRKAEELLNRAEETVKKSGYRQALAETYKTKAGFYEQQGNYKAALENYKLNKILSDSIADENLNAKSKELHIQLQTEEKERAIALQQVEIKNKNRFLTLLTLFSVIAVALIVFLFRLWRRRQRQNEKLTALNAAKDKLFSIISHDLKSPAIAQKMAVEAMIKDIGEYNDNVLNKLKVFRDAAESQLSLLQNLLNWTNLQTGRMEYNPVAFNVSESVLKIVDLYRVSAQNKQIQIITDCPPECVTYADKQMINAVIRNLLNNAIKFSPPYSEVKVSISYNKETICLSIADKGAGMSQQQIDNLLKQGKNTSKEDTRGEKSSGLGLIICKDLLEKNKSALHISRNENGGITVFFNLSEI